MEKVASESSHELEDIVNVIVAGGSDEATDVTGFPVVDGGLYAAQNPEELANVILFLKNYQKEHGIFSLSLEIGIASGGTLKIIRDYVSIKDTVIVDNRGHGNVGLHWDRIKQLVKSNIIGEI